MKTRVQRIMGMYFQASKVRLQPLIIWVMRWREPFLAAGNRPALKRLREIAIANQLQNCTPAPQIPDLVLFFMRCWRPGELMSGFYTERPVSLSVHLRAHGPMPSGDAGSLTLLLRGVQKTCLYPSTVLIYQVYPCTHIYTYG